MRLLTKLANGRGTLCYFVIHWKKFSRISSEFCRKNINVKDFADTFVFQKRPCFSQTIGAGTKCRSVLQITKKTISLSEDSETACEKRNVT